MKNFSYPPAPEIRDIQQLNPSKAYKAEVIKVTFAILFFVFVYLVLMALALGMAAIVSYIGIQVILFKPMFITLMLGIGCMGLGLMVVYFLIKFVFAIKKVDRSRYTEIKEKDYPELFTFIRQLSQETMTPMPKRIYVSPEVNACVFYDSSFFSMFLPVKKNLLIGLGLVNSLNMSEFKSVIAHEFGHFSQHSMRLGTYVFNVNKVIYNMLYENDGYAGAIDSWASASGYFAIFARLTVRIVIGIQWVLQKVYLVVNKSNLSLSRQMEHHADAVSAFVCGPSHLITALKRLEISDSCYQQLLNKYDKWITENIKPENLFGNHSEVIMHYATENGMALTQRLPVIESGNSLNLQQSKLVIKDQWASHPSTPDREKYLKSLNIGDTTAVMDSPWVLFQDTEHIQKDLTLKLFDKIKYNGKVTVMDMDLFKEKYFKEFSSKSFPKEYKGFYNDRKITVIDPETIDVNADTPFASFEELFIAENAGLPQKLKSLQADIETLNSIYSKEYEVKTFEFDGKKCGLKDIPAILTQLEGEKSLLEAKIEDLDRKILENVVVNSADTEKEVYWDLYHQYQSIAKDSEVSSKLFFELSNVIVPIYQGRFPLQEAVKIIENAKIIEKKIVQHILELFDEVKQQEYLVKTDIELMEKYLAKDRKYIDESGFNNTELDVFNEAMIIFVRMVLEREFRIKNKLLLYQLDIVKRKYVPQAKPMLVN